MTYRLADIITILTSMGETVQNASELTSQSITIDRLATLTAADNRSLSFLANPKYREQLSHTQAIAVLVTADMAAQCPTGTLPIIVKSPYVAYAALTSRFAYRASLPTTHIHPTAIIADTAKLAPDVRVGAYCVIGENVEIGQGSTLGNHVVLEDFVKVGQSCEINSHVFIAHHCELGNNVVLHSHASIGNEGFGYAPKGDTAKQGWQKIHQLGRVIIGNHVRVGSHTCIDRGALDDTVIEDHVIIDNLVQIAHNVRIGAGTAIAACTGIAGSTQVGKRCVLAGGVGLVGHISLCDDVTVTGMTMVTKSITEPGSYSSGTPMLPTALWRRAAVKFKQLVDKA